MIPMLTKSFQASAAIAGNRIVAFSDVSASSKVATATTNLVPAVGVSDAMGAALGDMCDVHLLGIYPVKLGGTVTAGQPLMSDATGQAIAAVGAAASTRRVIGFALEPGVSGDLIDVLLSQCLLDRA